MSERLLDRIESPADLRALPREDVGRVCAELREEIVQRVAKSGDASFIGVGIPMFQGEGAFTEAELKATALATRGWWHHSIECTIDKVDWDYMQPHVRVYAAYLWELCTAPVLPFTYAPVAGQIIKRLSELEGPGAAVGLRGVLEAARAFEEAAQRLRPDLIVADITMPRLNGIDALTQLRAVLPALPASGTAPVRLVESAKTIVRVGPDGSDSVATGKTGQAVEIRGEDVQLTWLKETLNQEVLAQ